MRALRGQEGVRPRALEFVILTAARAGEVLKMCAREIDFAAKVWTVPAERMKSGREHRVPLSKRAIEILAAVRAGDPNGLVFPASRNQPLRTVELDRVRNGIRGSLTTHGFRSTFKDWASERTSFPNEVSEAALAHVVGDQVEAAYRRGDLFEKRRRLMDAWAEFCGKPSEAGKVVSIGATKQSY
jgi:integrase